MLRELGMEPSRDGGLSWIMTTSRACVRLYVIRKQLGEAPHAPTFPPPQLLPVAHNVHAKLKSARRKNQGVDAAQVQAKGAAQQQGGRALKEGQAQEEDETGVEPQCCRVSADSSAAEGKAVAAAVAYC